MRSIDFDRSESEAQRWQIAEMVAKLAVLQGEISKAYDAGERLYISDVLADAATVLHDLQRSGKLAEAIADHVRNERHPDARAEAAAKAVAELEAPTYRELTAMAAEANRQMSEAADRLTALRKKITGGDK